MGSALADFLELWKGHSPTESFHPVDRRALDRLGIAGRFANDLAPYPYSGDLRNARVWILMRNPSVGPNDRIQERAEPLSALLEANLDQDFGAYPFLNLDPALTGWDASNYWWLKVGFSQLTNELAQLLDRSFDEIRQELSRRVAVLEACPYRSPSFVWESLELPSAKLARRVAHEALREAPSSGRAFVSPWDIRPWAAASYASAPYFRWSPARRFSFKLQGMSGFGRTIARYAFGLNAT